MTARHTTIDAANDALNTAVLDVTADMGEEAADQCMPDLVRMVAADCSALVAVELMQRNGVQA